MAYELLSVLDERVETRILPGKRFHLVEQRIDDARIPGHRTTNVHAHHIGGAFPHAVKRRFAIEPRHGRGKRLAYGLIFEPIDPEVESTRLKYRRSVARVFEAIIKEGITSGEFRKLDVEVAAACVVGAFMEGLISVLAPGAGGVPSRTQEFANSIADLCLAAVAKRGNRLIEHTRPANGAVEAVVLKKS